jgi:hypothetical protein
MSPESIISIFLGIGLAAAVGFRIFIPLLVLSLATHFGHIPVNESFAWVGSTSALIVLAVATLAELTAYFIPFVDNLLDTVSVPLAAVAGTLVMAAVLIDMPEVMTWSLAIIAGGGTAAAISGTTATTRAASSATTLGIANPIVAVAETGGALSLSILSIIFPVLAMLLVVIVLFIMYLIFKKIFKKKKTA